MERPRDVGRLFSAASKHLPQKLAETVPVAHQPLSHCHSLRARWAAASASNPPRRLPRFSSLSFHPASPAQPLK